jgi:hypothetical protein
MSREGLTSHPIVNKMASLLLDEVQEHGLEALVLPTGGGLDLSLCVQRKNSVRSLLRIEVVFGREESGSDLLLVVMDCDCIAETHKAIMTNKGRGGPDSTLVFNTGDLETDPKLPDAVEQVKALVKACAGL